MIQMWRDLRCLSGHCRSSSCHSCLPSLGSHQVFCIARNPAPDAASSGWCCTYSLVVHFSFLLRLGCPGGLCRHDTCLP